jgi:toxin ParE1/3/4
MSSPRRLIIAANARSDIRGILLHTVQRWGATQRARHKTDIDATFALLLEHPSIGASREGLLPGIRARPIGPRGQHIVYYRVEPVASIMPCMTRKMDATSEPFDE